MSDSPAKTFIGSLAVFRDIMRLRSGPEDLPVSAALLVITIVAQTALALGITAILPPVPVPEAARTAEDHSMAVMLIDLAAMLFWGWAILRVAGKPERFLQMMTALFGIQLILLPVLAPAVWVVEYFGKESGRSAFGLLILVAALVWGLVAMARVLRSATGWPAVFCASLVIAQGLAAQLIAMAIFPDLFKVAT